MLFIMRGTTCSGKDTFIEQFFPESTNILSSDFMRGLLTGDVECQRDNDLVFKTLFEIMENRFVNRADWTVFNATNLRIKDCRPAIDLCLKFRVPFTFLSIHPPSIEVLKSRNEQRYNATGIHIPEAVIEKHYDRYFNAFEPFALEAVNNPLCSLIEVDQNYDVKRNL